MKNWVRKRLQARKGKHLTVLTAIIYVQIVYRRCSIFISDEKIKMKIKPSHAIVVKFHLKAFNIFEKSAHRGETQIIYWIK